MWMHPIFCLCGTGPNTYAGRVVYTKYVWLLATALVSSLTVLTELITSTIVHFAFINIYNYYDSKYIGLYSLLVAEVPSLQSVPSKPWRHTHSFGPTHSRLPVL